MRLFAAIGLSLLSVLQCSPSAANDFEAGERYEIVVFYETKTERDLGSSSSGGRTTYLEHVVSQGDDCTVREFDLIDDPDRERPLVAWEMPARISACFAGERTLVDVPEMEARLERFLSEAKISRDQCGTHYFTWNAFKIECDPQSILETIDHIDLAAIPLTDGAGYEVPGGAGPVILTQISQDETGAIWEGEVAVDQEYIREEAARTDVVVGELMGENVSFEEALAALQGQTYSGSISVRFEAGPAMHHITRTIQSTVRVVDSDGEIEDRSAKEVTQRKRAGR